MNDWCDKHYFDQNVIEDNMIDMCGGQTIHENDFNSIKSMLEDSIRFVQRSILSDTKIYGTNARLVYDLTPYCIKRRIRAVLNCRKKILKELSGSGSKDAIDDFMLFSNTLIFDGGYNSTDYCYNIILASAIWILDQLQFAGRRICSFSV